VTAGVAIVGASVIAVTPITPTPTQPQARSHAVQLSAASQYLDSPSPFAALSSASALPQAAVGAGLMAGSSFENPITRWVDVFEATGVSLTALYNEWAKDPFPVVRQIIANQTGYANLIGNSLTTTVTGLSNWATGSTSGSLPVSIRVIAQALAQGEILAAQTQFSRALTELGASLFAMLDVLSLPYKISANVTAVLQEFVMVSMFDTGIVGKTGLGVLGLVQTAVQSVATIGQAVVDAGRAGDPLAALSAIVNAPAEFTDAMLNGIVNRFGRRVGGLLTLSNNLTSWGVVGGLLIHIPRLIAAAITPPAPPAPAVGTASTELTNDVAALPSADAKTVSLETGATPAPETSGEASAEGETGTAAEEEAPEAETPATDVVDEADETDSIDETDESEVSEELDESEVSEELDASEESESPNGSTDLSDGNMATPGETGSDTDAGTGSDSDSTDESDTPTTGTGNGAGTGSDSNDSGNDAGGSNDGSDGGSDS
jgi:hypothetical protein